MADYYQSTHSILIQQSPEKIYEALTDWPLRSQWRKGVEIAWEGEKKASLHQRVTFRVRGSLFSYAFCFRITGLEPPQRFYLQYEGKPLRGRAAVEIRPESKGSLVSFHWMKVEPQGWWPKLYFALGLGMRTHRQGVLETLRMLKDHFENS